MGFFSWFTSKSSKTTCNEAALNAALIHRNSHPADQIKICVGKASNGVPHAQAKAKADGEWQWLENPVTSTRITSAELSSTWREFSLQEYFKFYFGGDEE